MSDNKINYLPIGSIVLVNDGEKKMMIIGYKVRSAEDSDKVWDYLGCIYPIGVFSKKVNFVFDHKEIREICFSGFSDEEHKKLVDRLNSIKDSELNKNNS